MNLKDIADYGLKRKLSIYLGTLATQCLSFWSFDFSAEIAIKCLAKMKNLKVLDITVSDECDDKVSEHLPSSLRFLRLNGFPFSSLPNTFQHLVGLQIRHSNIVQLWKDGEGKVLSNLRFLELFSSKLKTFDLRFAPNLEQLTIFHCDDFVKLHIPADHCLRLEHLDLSYNSKLKTIHLKNTPNIKTLILNDCRDLVEFQMPAQSLKLEHLDLSYSKLTKLHLWNTPNLKTLKLNNCHDLVEFQMLAENVKLEYLDLDNNSWLTKLYLGDTPNLKTLILYRCRNLVLLPELGRVKCLKELNIRKIGICHLPQSTFQMKGLRIIGSTEIFESYGLAYKIQTSNKGKWNEETIAVYES